MTAKQLALMINQAFHAAGAGIELRQEATVLLLLSQLCAEAEVVDSTTIAGQMETNHGTLRYVFSR